MLAFLRTSFDVMKAIPKVLQMHFSKIVAIKNFFLEMSQIRISASSQRSCESYRTNKNVELRRKRVFSLLANLSRVIPTKWGNLEV